MTKLLHYVKRFWVLILACVGLLFVQAYCELTLPDYMQNIVDKGITNQGIENGLYQQVSQKTLDGLLMFADEDQKEEILNGYTLYDSSSASSDLLEAIPALKTEPVYVLNEDVDTDRMESSLVSVQMVAASLAQEASTTKRDVKSLLMSNGLEHYQVLAKKNIETYGESTVASMGAQMVKSEYENLGLDVDSMQQGYILHSGLIMLGYSLLSAFCAIMVGFLASRIAAGAAKRMRQDVFEKVTYFTNENFNHFSTSTLITRTTNDIQQVQMAIVMVLRIVVYAPIMGIGALVHVINSEANMTWIIALCVVTILSVVGCLFAMVMPKFKMMQTFIDKLNGVVRELLDGMLVIRAFNNQDVEKEKFEKANKDITRVGLFTTRAMAMLMPIMMFLLNGTSLLILWFGAKQVDSGAIQVGSIMAFMQYAMQVIMAFLMITMVSIILPRANVSAGRIVEILEEPIAITDIDTPKTMDPSLCGHVTFDHVSFRYPGSDEDVLHDISFTSKPGQVTAFIGSTGSGKSTLVNLLMRFYDVSEGSIIVDGVDIKDLAQKDLHDKIGYIPQKGILLSGTIESNLLYANEKATNEDIDEALRIAQAKEFVDTKPEGIQTPISQGATNVSGGQKQRLAIARAIVKQPEIYIFDDSFSALDFKTDAALRAALMESVEKTKSTVFIVAQRISSILHADQIIVLDEGKMVGKGTHAQLMKSCAVYQEIASSQLSKEELDHVE